MNGYDEACTVEAKAMRILAPFWKEKSDNGQVVYIAKGLLAKVLQETYGDVFWNRSARLETIELKAEEKWTDNLFLETFSNRNLEDPASYAMRGINRGWLDKVRADWLFYYFLSNDTLCVMKMLPLQRWAFGVGSKPGRIYDFPEKQQRRYDQLNDTWGRCVPVSILEQELKPPLKRMSVQQLQLRFEQEVA